MPAVVFYTTQIFRSFELNSNYRVFLNPNFHLIRWKPLPTKDFELTGSDLEVWYTKNLNMCTRNIILNEIYPKKGHVINFICLITKQFIYRQKCMGLQLNIITLKSLISRIENIEKYIAIKNGRQAYHNKKWKQACEMENLQDFIDLYLHD